MFIAQLLVTSLTAPVTCFTSALLFPPPLIHSLNSPPLVLRHLAWVVVSVGPFSRKKLPPSCTRKWKLIHLPPASPAVTFYMCMSVCVCHPIFWALLQIKAGEKKNEGEQSERVAEMCRQVVKWTSFLGWFFLLLSFFTTSDVSVPLGRWLLQHKEERERGRGREGENFWSSRRMDDESGRRCGLVVNLSIQVRPGKGPWAAADIRPWCRR